MILYKNDNNLSMEINLTKKEQLIYDLIYEENISKFEICIYEYITDLSELESFTIDILNKLEKTKIEVIEQTFILTEYESFWIILINR